MAARSPLKHGIRAAVPLTRLAPPGPERFGYLPLGAEQLYCVQHQPASGRARAKVLLAGPLGLERQTSYTTWLRWARHLASEGFETLHFDYRGMGESTGRFRDHDLSEWKHDVLAALRFLQGDTGHPVLLMGLRLGALLVSQVFAEGHGDAMLLWDAPTSGHAMLTEVLRRKLASDLMEGVAGPRKSREGYIAELLEGAEIEVEGYIWTQRLWRNAAAFPCRIPGHDEPRPWRLVQLDQRPTARTVPSSDTATVPVPKPPFWGHDPYVIARVSELFQHGTEFLREAARTAGSSP